MRSSKTSRFAATSATLLASAVLGAGLVAGASQAALTPSKTKPPRINTGGATHVRATSALLTAIVDPEGTETSYYFQYGTTTAYGLQTPSVAVGNGIVKVKVGQAVSGLTFGAVYHFRVVAVANGKTYLGRDHAFSTKSGGLRFEFNKLAQVTYGKPFILSGTLVGLAAASHALVLQATPFPYGEAFTPIGLPGASNAAGLFSFRITNLLRSTEFRLATLDSRPIYSPVVTIRVALRVTLKVRSTSTPGRVRLSGTVSPAAVGSQVLFQVSRPLKAGRSESAKFVTAFLTKVKKGGRTFSRFSLVVDIRRSGHYRAYVKLAHPGALVSGYSQTVMLHAGPRTSAKKGGRHRRR